MSCKTFTYHQQGMTLIELMIAMSLGLLIVGSMFAAYINTTTTSRSLMETSLVTENGRYATQVLSDEVQLAGFFGFLDNQEKRISTSPTLPNACTISMTMLIDGVAMPIQGYNNVGAASGAAANIIDACLPSTDSIKTGTDILIIRRANTSVASATLVSNDYYIQSIATRYFIGKGSETFPLTKKDGTTAEVIRRYEQNIFYVDAATDQLKKLVLSNGGYRVEAIADNVDGFHVEYGIDYSRNGAPNESTFGASDNFVVAPTTISAWQNVVAVRAFLILHSENESASVSDAKTYQVGLDGTEGPFNDNFKRRLFYFSERANNISMRRENS
jgi:type IV pilus assembly protein PilW